MNIQLEMCKSDEEAKETWCWRNWLHVSIVDIVIVSYISDFKYKEGSRIEAAY